MLHIGINLCESKISQFKSGTYVKKGGKMNVKVKDLMTTNVCHAKPSDTVGKLKRIFKNNNFNVLPVLKDDELVGVISQSDILNVDNEFSQIHNHMHKQVITISSYSNINEAAHLMKKYHLHHLIVTHEKKMIGIISSYDLLNLLEKRIYKFSEEHKKTA